MTTYTKSKLNRKEIDDITIKLTPFINSNSDKFRVAGSYRRKKFRMGDIDFILDNGNLEQIRNNIYLYYPIVNILRSGAKVLSIIIEYNDKNIQVEFMSVPSKSFGSAILHSTGSGKFNMGLRSFAKRKNLLLNQYGLIDRQTRQPVVDSSTELRIFGALGLKYIPPKYRENFWSVKNQFSF